MSAAPKGIVVLGSPRSGTTLVRRILDAHPNIACPPETYLFSAAARFLHTDRFALGLGIGVLDGLSFAGFGEDQTLARLREMCFGFLDDYAKQAGKARWAEKTAFHAFYVPTIQRLCEGHVQFICLHRHGMDVAPSFKDLVDKTGGYVDELRPYIQLHPEPHVALAHAWVDAANAIADLAEALPEDQAISVRYEDLTDDPEAELARLFTFLGEDWQPELLGEALGDTGTLGFGDWKTYKRTAVDRSSVERWRELPRPVQVKLAAICNPTLERLGYAPVELMDRPIDAAMARKRYEFGLRMQVPKKS